MKKYLLLFNLLSIFLTPCIYACDYTPVRSGADNAKIELYKKIVAEMRYNYKKPSDSPVMIHTLANYKHIQELLKQGANPNIFSAWFSFSYNSGGVVGFTEQSVRATLLPGERIEQIADARCSLGTVEYNVPLQDAVINADEEIALLFLEHGAQINADIQCQVVDGIAGFYKQVEYNLTVNNIKTVGFSETAAIKLIETLKNKGLTCHKSYMNNEEWIADSKFVPANIKAAVKLTFGK